MRIYTTDFIKTAFIFHASRFLVHVQKDFTTISLWKPFGVDIQRSYKLLSKNADIRSAIAAFPSYTLPSSQTLRKVLDESILLYAIVHREAVSNHSIISSSKKWSVNFPKAMASFIPSSDTQNMYEQSCSQDGIQDLNYEGLNKDDECSSLTQTLEYQQCQLSPESVEPIALQSSAFSGHPTRGRGQAYNHGRVIGQGRHSLKRRFYSDSRGSLAAPVSRACFDKPVAIIGGGIGGMALALALQHRGIPVKLFEKDDSFSARRQGYGLTLQQGVMSLRALGFTAVPSGVVTTRHASYTSDGQVLGVYGHDIPEDVRRKGNDASTAASTSNAQASTYVPKDTAGGHMQPLRGGGSGRGRVSEARQSTEVNSASSKGVIENRVGLISIVGRARHQVHLPRQVLRELLMDRVEPGNIAWSKKLVSYEDSCGADGVSLRFSDGSSFNCCLLVGADGIHSIVRQMKLPEARLEFLKLVVILGITRNVEGDANVMCVRQWLDGSTRVFTMPFDPEHTMWQLSFPADEQEAFRISASAESLREEALRRCGRWHSELTTILQSTEPGLVSGHPVYDRTPMESSQLRGSAGSRVTLIGDAVHPMSPFKGQGANQALLDAMALAEALSYSDLVSVGASVGVGNRTVDDALAAFEAEMCSRSAPKVLKSRSAAESLHSPAALVAGNMTRAWVAATSATKS